jgi:hypothetical protein
MLDSACKYERSLIRRAPANSVGGRCFNPAPAIYEYPDGAFGVGRVDVCWEQFGDDGCG